MPTPVIEAVNYYGASRRVLAAASSSISANTLFRFFANQPALASSSREFNELSSFQGCLPDNGYGKLTGVMVRPTVTPSATETTTLLDAQAISELLDSFRLDLIVNNRRVVRGPLFAFPHPPTWLQGFVYGTEAGAQEGWALAQNGGWCPMFSPQDVEPRQTLAVDLETILATTINSTSDLYVQVWLQTLEKKVL